ncbi:MAG: glycosyltransferase [Chloroflexota bacterium]
MMTQPRITAILCTYDRPDYLQKCLHSLAQQTLPADQFEVMVVDNGRFPTKTKAIVDQFPACRYVREPQAGLSQARNVGWQRATTDYIAYFDDDVLVDPDCLLTICQVFSEMEPLPGCVGGQVRPIWEAPRPDWLSDRLMHGLSLIDWETTPHFLPPEQWLVGCNMAFSRDLLAEVGGFPTHIGRVGTGLISMGETAVLQKLQQLGYASYYHPAASVRHHIPASRLQKSWFVRRTFWNGVSRGLLEQEDITNKQRWQKISRAGRQKLLSHNAWASLIGRDPGEKRLYQRCVTYGWLGYCWAMAQFNLRGEK